MTDLGFNLRMEASCSLSDILLASISRREGGAVLRRRLIICCASSKDPVKSHTFVRKAMFVIYLTYLGESVDMYVYIS